jgi:Transposase DNA-binding
MKAIAGIEGEYEGAELGDLRLGRRLVRLASGVAAAPESSFPKRAESDSQMEATYRFLGNEKVGPSEILAPHARQTVKRAAEAGGDVVVAHDTTEFNFGKTGRRDLGRVGLGKSFGFYGHFALAVSRETRSPLGVLGMAIHQRDGKKGGRARLKTRTAPDNEGLRWGRLVAQVEKVLPGAIHAMDREADSYMLMAELVNAGHRFVIRMAQSTRKLAEGDDVSTVGEALVRARTVAQREVPICARGKSPMPSNRKHHPPRKARLAQLEVSSETVTIEDVKFFVYGAVGEEFIQGNGHRKVR